MIDLDQFKLLSQIDTPRELRALAEHELPNLAAEIREFMCQSLNICGGHFASGLGAVELTIALHYLYNTPQDRLIWDVGHQAYPHKILTGRKSQLTSIRQTDGLAPFPNPTESEYDHFVVGHASNSIGAALGMAKGSDRRCVAIIGDGAMTGGMAFEALNHAGDMHANLLVILNDNEMSISKNVGALRNHLAKLISGKLYSSVREGGKKVLKNVPPMWDLVKKTEMHLKGMVMPGTLFEALGFYYVGPIDGHDMNTVIDTLKNLRDQTGPKLLHVMTTKGKGYAPAEADPIRYHAVKPGFYNKEKSEEAKPSKPTYSQIFGDWICDMAEHDPKLHGITPAMCEGSALVNFSKRYPERYFDVGIAEQHCVTFAAGLAAEGLKPVVAIYSTFLQRAYDQLIHDVCIQNLPVLFAIDRAGIVGGDGTTHNGAFDLSYMRAIPNLMIMAPADENECRQMLYTGFLQNGPAAVRYPRGTGPGIPVDTKMQALEIGKAELRRLGCKIAFLSFGSMLYPSLEAAEQLDATVFNMRFVKPLDKETITQVAKDYDLIVTLEENVIAGGAGSAVNELLMTLPYRPQVLNLGFPSDYFVDHGDPATLLARCELDAAGILASVATALQAKEPSVARHQVVSQ